MRCGRLAPDVDQVDALAEMVSLLRLVFHSWRKFKTARLELAVGLVQKRLPLLARATA